nr:NADH dehydrogenase subunit 4L [Anomopsocus sp. AnspLA]
MLLNLEYFSLIIFFILMMLLWSYPEKFILMLLNLEYFSLIIFFILMMLLWSYPEKFILMYYLVFCVCEGAFGLSLLVILVRTYGNDFMMNMNVLKC